MKLVAQITWLIARSTGKPDKIDELEDGVWIEYFYFNFGLFSTQLSFSFKKP